MDLFLVSYPEIINVSEDKTGSDTIWEDMELNLFCIAHGKPSPKYSWHLNGKPLGVENSNRIRVRDGNLTIFKPRVNDHQGLYRCFATNALGTVMSRLIQVNITRKC